MKKALLLIILSAAAAVLISCASAPYSRWNSSSGRAINLVNAGDSRALETLTSSPFLFDREIIILEKDIAMIWKNIADAGFTFSDAVEVKSIPIAAEDYRLFGDTMEVKTWFEKYLPEEPSLVKIKTQKSLYYMILGERKWIKVEEETPPLSYGIYGRRGLFSFGVTSGSSSGRGGSSKQGYPAIYGFTGPVEGER